MKIKLSLTPDQVMSLEKLMNQVDAIYMPTTRQGKAIRSISFFVSDKINKAYRKLIKSTDLFSKKKVHISLEYHEANALFEIINTLIPYIETTTETKREYQTTSDFLHQKLV